MDHDGSLLAVLAQGRDRGLLGPGDLVAQIEHAVGFGQAWAAVAGEETFAGAALDLGSGGGLPGLVLARRWTASTWVLLDAQERSTAFLTEAVARLGLDPRVVVVRERAEVLGRTEAHRGAYGLVVARGFGSPAVTAECAAPLLGVGGRLVVSEPPDGALRWPPAALAELGLEPERAIAPAGRFHYQVLRQVALSPPRFPRRVGIPGKRPLF